MRFFRPSHQHAAFSATLLLMAIGYIREAYIAYAFGAGQQTDAYVAAFTLPDWLNYIVAGDLRNDRRSTGARSCCWVGTGLVTGRL